MYNNSRIPLIPHADCDACSHFVFLHILQALSGVSYLPSSGTVAFEDGQRYGILYVPVENTAYLAMDSTFTLTLTSVQFIGVGGEKSILRCTQ